MEDHNKQADVWYFDDFFVAKDDPGVEVEVELSGRKVPMRFKRALTLDDVESSKEKAIAKRVNAKGEIEVTKIDENAFAVELLSRAILEWPFVHKSGKKVPVSKEVISSLMAQNAQTLQELAMKLITQKAEQVGPLGNNSANH